MKILVYGLNFAPEPVGVGRYTAEMVEGLRDAGHEVRVVTALPYYPEWKVNDAYSGWGYAFENWKGVAVMRAPLWVPYRPGGRKRVLHLLSFAVTSLPLMVRSIFWRPDVVWMAAPTFVCAPAALVTAKLTGAKSWIHIQDFEIDIAFSMSLISGGISQRWIRKAESWLLRRFDCVSSISEAMVARALAKGVHADKLSHFPNWAAVHAVVPLRSPSAYRAELGIAHDAVVALYSGTMGVKHGIDWVAEAAVLTQTQPDVYFVLCGDGALKEAAAAKCGHLPNVRFIPFQPVERLGELLGLADIHLLPQRADAAGMVMPSKLAAMLASGRPVVCMANRDTELAVVVQSCGEVVRHGDVTGFSNAILHLARHPQLRAELGGVGRLYADTHLAAHAIVGRMEAEFVSLGEKRRGRAEAGLEDRAPLK